jgi:hypothetical protein
MTFMKQRGHVVLMAFVTLAAVVPAAGLRAQGMTDDRYVLPAESVQELFRRDKNLARLDRLSPDGDHFFIPQFQELTDLKLMSQRTLRLAILELCPDVNREWRLREGRACDGATDHDQLSTVGRVSSGCDARHT